MDILKRNLAPISSEAWELIDSTAKIALQNYLSARKVVSVNGPMGWSCTAVPEGRLDSIKLDSEEEGLGAGNYKVKPLTEVRAVFHLSKWELDNIARGAKDIALDSLEEAAKKIALFEESAIYNGNAGAGIKGIVEEAGCKMELGEEAEDIVENIAKAMGVLNDNLGQRPYTLVVSEELYGKISKEIDDVSLYKTIREMISGDIISSKAIDCAVLVPQNDEDFEMTVGQDFSIGYEWDDPKTVQLFITESFTFRALNGKKIVVFE